MKAAAHAYPEIVKRFPCLGRAFILYIYKQDRSALMRIYFKASVSRETIISFRKKIFFFFSDRPRSFTQYKFNSPAESGYSRSRKSAALISFGKKFGHFAVK